MSRSKKTWESKLVEANNIINQSPAVICLWENAENWPVEYILKILNIYWSIRRKILLKVRYYGQKSSTPTTWIGLLKRFKSHSLIKDETDFSHEPYRVIAKNGQVKWVDDRTTIRRDSRGQISHYQGILLDVTKRMIAEKKIQRQLFYEKCIKSASSSLLKPNDPDQNITEALSHILEASGVARVYIFQNYYDEADELCMRQIHEVCAPGIESEINNPDLQHVVYADGFQRWRELLSEGHSVWGDVKDFPEEEGVILESQGIISILVIPLSIGDCWYGFIGFDETRHKRNWMGEDEYLLGTAADLISSYLAQIQSKQALRVSEERFRAISEYSHNAICVLDEKAKIIWVNKKPSKLAATDRMN